MTTNVPHIPSPRQNGEKVPDRADEGQSHITQSGQMGKRLLKNGNQMGSPMLRAGRRRREPRMKKSLTTQQPPTAHIRQPHIAPQKALFTGRPSLGAILVASTMTKPRFGAHHPLRLLSVD